MNLLRLLLAAVIGAASLAPMAAQAQAPFGNCADPAYLQVFDGRERKFGYDCVERLREVVKTEFGEFQIRVVHDIGAGWINDTEGLIPEIERGLRAAVAAFGQLGKVRLANYTILIDDQLPPPEGKLVFGDFGGNTGYDPRRPECQTVLYPTGLDRALIAPFVVHEFFHCVQHANLSPAQMRTSGRGLGQGGDWWMEGSAAWFVALALPDRYRFADYVTNFDKYTATEPLYALAYTAVVFFLWLGQTQRPDAVLPFLSRMADSADVPAQQAAMAAALPAADWLRFVEDYLDRRIVHPHGLALPFAPGDGQTMTWTTTMTVPYPLAPFTIARGWIDLQCGRWATSVTPSRHYAVRPDGGGSWGDLPTSVSTLASEPGRFRFAAFNATTSPVTLPIEARREAACVDCAGTRELDACTVGVWRQTGGGAAAWAKANLPPGITIPFAQMSDVVMTLRGDGTYLTVPISGEARGEGVTPKGRVVGTATVGAQVTGRWSAKEGTLNMCPEAGGATVSGGISLPVGGGVPIPGGPKPAATMQLSYTCLPGGPLETKITFPGISAPLTTIYSPVPAAPETPPPAVPETK